MLASFYGQAFAICIPTFTDITGLTMKYELGLSHLKKAISGFSCDNLHNLNYYIVFESFDFILYKILLITFAFANL